MNQKGREIYKERWQSEIYKTEEAKIEFIPKKKWNPLKEKRKKNIRELMILGRRKKEKKRDSREKKKKKKKRWTRGRWEEAA